jgi:hypothetical protein
MLGDVRVSAMLVTAALALGGCVAAPIDARELACVEAAERAARDPHVGVQVEAASDGFVHCASCEPSCYRAIDTLRSWDVEARGEGGLVFDPSVAGATSPQRFAACETPPCAMTYEYVDGASYSRTYAAYDVCHESETPVWWELTWSATIPPETSITFQIRASRDAASLSSAEPISFTATTETEPRHPIGVELVTISMAWAPYVSVEAVLHPSADRRRAPVLRGMSLEMACTGPD